jgi:hypothetical protein
VNGGGASDEFIDLTVPTTGMRTASRDAFDFEQEARDRICTATRA